MQDLVAELRLVTHKNDALRRIAEMDQSTQGMLLDAAAGVRAERSASARQKRKSAIEETEGDLLMDSADTALVDPDVADEQPHSPTTKDAISSPPKNPAKMPLLSLPEPVHASADTTDGTLPSTRPRPPVSSSSELTELSSDSEVPTSLSGSTSKKRRTSADPVADTQGVTPEDPPTAAGPSIKRKLPKRQRIAPARYRGNAPPGPSTHSRHAHTNDHMKSVETHYNGSFLTSRVSLLESEVESLQTRLTKESEHSRRELLEVSAQLDDAARENEEKNKALREELEVANEREAAAIQATATAEEAARVAQQAMRRANEEFEAKIAALQAELSRSQMRAEDESARAQEETRLRVGYQAKADALDSQMVPEMWKMVFELDRLANERGAEALARRKFG